MEAKRGQLEKHSYLAFTNLRGDNEVHIANSLTFAFSVVKSQARPEAIPLFQGKRESVYDIIPGSENRQNLLTGNDRQQTLT